MPTRQPDRAPLDLPALQFEPSEELRDILAALHEQVSGLLAALPPIDPAFAQRLVELQQFETAMERMGLVAHPILLELHKARPDIVDVDRLATDTWEELRGKLARIAAQFGDARAAAVFEDMIAAHEARLYELVPIAAASLMERILGLVRRDGTPKKRDEWLESVVGRLSPWQLGGLPGIRVYQILLKHTFVQCWADSTADSMPYMNRHALAHGRGTKRATVRDSLNSLLLAHFVFWLSIVVRDEPESPALDS